MSDVDYSKSGLFIQGAMLDYMRRHKGTAVPLPPRISWGQWVVQTADRWDVDTKGTVTFEVIRGDGSARQGFDIKCEGGGLQLENGKVVPVLRTWDDSKYAPRADYPFTSRKREMWFWNVYLMNFPTGDVEEKWTMNAGFWLETVSPKERVYHCSPGFAQTPDFEHLVVRLRVS